MKLSRRSLLALLGLGGLSTGLLVLNKEGIRMSSPENSNTKSKMPVLFLGHGSPMNAIEENDFTQALKNMSAKIPTPKAILCVSAHWLTEDTVVTSMTHPKTIHDFYGFPEALFKVQYPAPGKPELAKNISETIRDPKVFLDDHEWGLDHGTWSVLRHVYPKADIPVLQLSVAIGSPGEFHLQMGEKLRWLREQGVLIVGSGNIVHNLRQIRWESDAKAFDWALEFDQWSKEKILSRDFKTMAQKFFETSAGKLSVPTPDHYYPLLYILGASEKTDEVSFEYEGIQNGSISMRCVKFG